MNDLAQIPAGATFAGRYAIVRLLRAGDRGAVYEATQLDSRRNVALKVVHPAALDPQARAILVEQARAISQLDSPFLAAVVDAGVDPSGVPYVASEMLPGEDLGAALAKRGKYAMNEVAPLLLFVARGLDRAHARGIVHGDLAPEHVFIVAREGPTPVVKVLGLGVARIHGISPLFASPEALAGGALGAPSDVWSLGLVAFALLVGRPYWHVERGLDSVRQEVAAGAVESAVARARSVGVSVPAAFDSWFQRCVHRDPTQRFPSILEAAQSLSSAIVSASRVSLPPAPPVAPGTVAMSPETVANVVQQLEARASHTPSIPPAPAPHHHVKKGSAAPFLIGGGLVVAALVVVAVIAVSGVGKNDVKTEAPVDPLVGAYTLGGDAKGKITIASVADGDADAYALTGTIDGEAVVGACRRGTDSLSCAIAPKGDLDGGWVRVVEYDVKKDATLLDGTGLRGDKKQLDHEVAKGEGDDGKVGGDYVVSTTDEHGEPHKSTLTVALKKGAYTIDVSGAADDYGGVGLVEGARFVVAYSTAHAYSVVAFAAGKDGDLSGPAAAFTGSSAKSGKWTAKKD